MNYLKNTNIFRYNKLNNKSFTFYYDNKDLNKYYNIRKNIFEKVWNIKYSCDEYDNRDNIILIKKNNNIIGGISAIVSTNNNRILLPGEKLYNYNYREAYPIINNDTYGEIFRFCVIPDERNTQVNKILFLKALKKMEYNNCNYIFGVCPKKLIDYYKYMFNSNGYTFNLTNNKNYVNDKISYSYLFISKKIKS